MESRFERERRLIIGSICQYKPKVQKYVIGKYQKQFSGKNISHDTFKSRRSPIHDDTQNCSIEFNDHSFLENNGRFGCNITRYSNKHIYSPLTCSASKLNFTTYKTATPTSIHYIKNRRHESTDNSKLISFFKVVEKSSNLKHPTIDLSNKNNSNDRNSTSKCNIYKDIEEIEYINNHIPNQEEVYNKKIKNIIEGDEQRNSNELNREQIITIGNEQLESSTILINHISRKFKLYKFVTKALYDFKAENNKELNILKGDTVIVQRKVDSNWYEGECNMRHGIFPISYVASNAGVKQRKT
uniref:Putative LOC101907303 [Bos taurus] n=1 Tax=Lepeophtheirus salmonis TaxID=72036 RepID=A0A0K2TCB1_LEPSM